jgi:hypothetical protein
VSKSGFIRKFRPKRFRKIGSSIYRLQEQRRRHLEADAGGASTAAATDSLQVKVIENKIR